MILEAYDKKINNFIKRLENKLNKYNIKFIVSLKDYVVIENSKCNGYFDEENKVLAISVGKPIKEWFPILVHESCHFEQWIAKCKTWIDYTKLGDDDIFTSILDGKSKMSEEEIYHYLSIARDMELDCERRTLKTIKKYNLPIDYNLYAKGASAYIYFYNYLAIYKKWYIIGKEPYKSKEILKHMPKELNGDYSILPEKLIKYYHKCTEYKGAK